MNIRVLGLGNSILRDDAIGLLAAEQLRDLEPAGVSVIATEESGLALLDFLVDQDRVLVLDAIQTGKPPGTILEFSMEDADWQLTSNPHGTGLPEVVGLGRALGQHMPSDVKVLAIQVLEAKEVFEGLTEPLQAALPGLVARARAILAGWLGAPLKG
jgi:hydrogenase maturation protease